MAPPHFTRNAGRVIDRYPRDGEGGVVFQIIEMLAGHWRTLVSLESCVYK